MLLPRSILVMRNPFKSFESRLKLYWFAWIGAVVVTLLLRFTLFLRASEQTRFFLCLAFWLGTWLPVIFINVIEAWRMKRYVETYQPSRWDHLGVRMLIWRFSRNDCNDPTMTVLRREQRRLEHYLVVAFISLPAMALILMV